jgi:hypothetical protein
MAVVQNTYTGDGVTVLYSLSFSYLDQADVKVSVNGTIVTNYIFATTSSIQFLTAPGAGAAIRIYRETDIDQASATIFPGSAIKAQDLNDNFTQTLYISQETKNTADEALTTSQTAVSGIANATTTANNALNVATNAAATANTAFTTANTANSTANAATSTANNALSVANAANATAVSADTKADQALIAVSSAVATQLVANVAAIPVAPANNTYVEVQNSTGIESFTPLAGIPVGFVGDSGLTVKIVYSTTGPTWNWISYAPNNAEQRYLKRTGGTLTGALLADDSTSTAAPPIAFDGDTDTGLAHPGANEIALVSGGTVRLSSDGAGNISIPGTLNVVGAVTENGQGLISAGDTNVITSSMLVDGTIVNNDVNANAGVEATKLSFIQPPSNSSGSPILGVARTVSSKLREVVSVKDFGAVGDGIADDTLAIQKTFDWLAQRQVDTGIQGPYGHVHFPQGVYKLTSHVNVYGYVSITGVGTGYIMGSIIRQATANADIFRFFSNFLDLGLGVNVQGLIFEHMDGDGNNTGTGVALKFPRIATHYPPFNGQVMASASHYIRDCRYGALYRFGKFAEFETGGDIVITGCCIDVLRGAEAIKIGSINFPTAVGDVRIVNNLFWSANTSINVAHAENVLISDNIFSQQEVVGGSAIKLKSDTATITAGKINAVIVSNNMFTTHHRCLDMDGSAINVTYSNNTHKNCLNHPLVLGGNQQLRRFKLTNNRFHLANNFVDPAGEIPTTTYPNANAVINFTTSSTLVDSEIIDNRVDANGVNAVTQIFNDTGSASYLGSGMTIRNNVIENNTSLKGAYLTYVPASANELVVNSQRTFTGLPSAQPLFYFEQGGLSPEESVTFEIDYEVRCLSSVNLGTRVGKLACALLRLNQAGPATTQGVITELVGIADDYNGSGGVNLPIVQFTYTYSPNPSVNVTVTWPAYASTSTIVTCKAHSFRSTGTVIIKSAT